MLWLLAILWQYPYTQIVLAWLLVDGLTGIYHYITDKGWNLKSQVAQFQEHHITNTMQGYDWQPMVAGVPVVLVGIWLESYFVFTLGCFAILAQVPHYYAHVKNPPAVVKWLQWNGLIITPEHHAKHHNGTFDQNFCIFTGWMDYALNPILKLFRAA